MIFVLHAITTPNLRTAAAPERPGPAVVDLAVVALTAKGPAAHFTTRVWPGRPALTKPARDSLAARGFDVLGLLDPDVPNPVFAKRALLPWLWEHVGGPVAEDRWRDPDQEPRVFRLAVWDLAVDGPVWTGVNLSLPWFLEGPKSRVEWEPAVMQRAAATIKPGLETAGLAAASQFFRLTEEGLDRSALQGAENIAAILEALLAREEQE